MEDSLKLALLIVSVTLRCQAIDDATAVRAIIGEAAGQTYREKLAVAGAIRNADGRNALIGLRNPRMIDCQPAKVWADARTAWAASRTNDLSCGATHFEAERFGSPWWSKQMAVTARVGAFVFYKEKK